MPFRVAQQNAARSLAARTLQKRWRAKQTGRKMTAARVAQISKAVINKQAETKSYISTAVYRAAYDDTFYYTNLFAPIVSGGGSENRVGEKIHAKSIKINWDCITYNNAGAGANDSKTLRLMVFSSKEQLGITTSALTQSSLFRAPIAAAASIGFVDYHKVNILVDKRINIETAVASVNGRRSGTIVVPFPGGKNLTYTSDLSSTYLKGNQYYFALGYYSNAGLGYTDFRSQFTVNFTDL